MVVASEVGSSHGILRRESVVATLEVRGRLNEEVCRGILMNVAPVLAEDHPLAAVAMYDQAEIATDLKNLEKVAEEFAANGIVLATPWAIVVPEGAMNDAIQYCRTMRALGFSRTPFTCRQKAHEWAARKAAIHEAMRAGI